jgi:cytochrome c oxidase assembly factor CtaG
MMMMVMVMMIVPQFLVLGFSAIKLLRGYRMWRKECRALKPQTAVQRPCLLLNSCRSSNEKISMAHNTL